MVLVYDKTLFIRQQPLMLIYPFPITLFWFIFLPKFLHCMHNIIRYLPVPAIIIDKDHSILYINYSGLKFFDLPFDAYTSQHINLLFPSLEIQDITRYKETSFLYYDKFSRKHLLNLTIDFYDKKGNIVLYFSNATDQREKNYSHSKAEYFKKRLSIFETFIDKIKEGVLVFSGEGKLLYYNERASKDFKINPNKLKKNNVWQLIDYFQDLEDWQEMVEKTKKKNKVQFTFQKDDDILAIETHYQTIDYVTYYMLVYTDISESTKDKVSIVEKSNQIDLFERNIPAVIFKLEFNDKGQNYLTYISQSFERLFGFRLETYHTKWQASLNIHPEDIVSFYNTMFESLETFSPFNYVGRLIVGEKTFWCEINAVPSIYNERINFDGIVLDITERIESDLQIKQKRAFNDSVLYNIPADVAVFDEQHRYLFLNMKGIANDELRQWMIGKTDFDYCSYRGLDTSLAEKRHAYFIQAKESKEQVDWIDVIHRNDKTVYILRRFYPFYVDDVFVYMIGYGVDITDMKTAQLHLSRAERENELILKSALDAVVMIDKEYKITFWNPQAEKIFGWNHSETDGKELFPLIIPEELKDYQSIEDFIAQNESTHLNKRSEFLAFKKDGEAFPIELTIVNINEIEQNIHYCIFIRDISSKKAKEIEIELQNKALVKQNKTLEQFNYIASHDLQEPLITLIGYSNLIEDEYSALLDEEGKLFLQFISKSASRMRSLIAGLLEYSRISTTENLVVTDLNDLVSDILSNLDDKIKRYEATVTVGPLPTLTCSAIHIGSLFQNLLSNAIKFSKKGIPPIVTIACEERKDDWLFTIKDNGIGINKNSLLEIFIMFRRLHNQDDYTGHGIGLAHCKRIVELHNGEIWVDSILGEGSQFSFTISKKI
jgi:PAS domain S-box-containing protein